MRYKEAYPLIKLFITKAKKLEESSFLDSITTEFTLDLKVEVNKPINVRSIRPNQESIDAFLLTFRYFLQDKDKISLRKIQNIIYPDLISKFENEEINTLRAELNDYLAESARIEIKGDKPTNREIMDTVLYGELAHSDEDKKQRFDRWMESMELAQEFIWHSFIISTIKTITVIGRIKCILCNIINKKQSVNGKVIVKNYGFIEFTSTYNDCCKSLN